MRLGPRGGRYRNAGPTESDLTQLGQLLENPTDGPRTLYVINLHDVDLLVHSLIAFDIETILATAI